MEWGVLTVNGSHSDLRRSAIGSDGMREADAPSTEVPDEELPSSVRRMGQMGWGREPLDDAVRDKRLVISPG
jgi:hypothetical protein